MTGTEKLRALLDERGVEYSYRSNNRYEVFRMDWCDSCADYLKSIYVKGACIVAELAHLTPAQAIAATLGRPKAKSHPYGYERDTGAYDCTRCECGCINDISATYCNDCGGEIEIDESAEKEYYDGYSKHTVYAKKHDDGSLEFCERRYVPEDVATLGGGECVEIVRCKDCKYCKQREAISPPMVCERWGYHNFKTEPERFCSWAEKAGAMSEQDTRNTREIINEIRASFGAGPTTMTDEQIEAGREVYGAKHDCEVVVVDELQDTREKLEADVRGYYSHTMSTRVWPPDKNKSTDVLMVPEDTVISWLDRQAAITRRETRQNWQDAPNVLDRSNPKTIADLQAKVDELTAERDKLREHGKYCLNNHVDYETEYLPTVKEFEAQIKDLETERDELQKVVRIQAESFRKLEQELKEAKAVNG